MKTPLLPTLGLALLTLSACRNTGGSAIPDELDLEAQQARMLELATPGAGHRTLDPIVGSFTAVGRFWMSPDVPPTEFTGTETTRWVLGGRFVEGHYTGDMMGLPFEGVSFTGYDNADGKYHGFWVDSFGTMMMPNSEGTASEDGKTITFLRRSMDPMLGYEVDMKEVLHIESAEHHTLTMYRIGPDGEEVKTMELDYRRVQG